MIKKMRFFSSTIHKKNNNMGNKAYGIKIFCLHLHQQLKPTEYYEPVFY